MATTPSWSPAKVGRGGAYSNSNAVVQWKGDDESPPTLSLVYLAQRIDDTEPLPKHLAMAVVPLPAMQQADQVVAEIGRLGVIIDENLGAGTNEERREMASYRAFPSWTASLVWYGMVWYDVM